MLLWSKNESRGRYIIFSSWVHIIVYKKEREWGKMVDVLEG